MDLICYLVEGWQPDIRPSDSSREWMDNTPDAFAYRCLPLNIANAHGWEIPSPCTFEASWNGDPALDGIQIRILDDTPEYLHPQSIFGQGVLTFHIQGLFRTPPGWNMWISGPPNRWKDGIAALSAVVETDWAPYTFTMNWRFTRPNTLVKFERGEPICFVFPVQRGILEQFEPKLLPITDDPELAEQFQAFCRSRDTFREYVEKEAPPVPTDQWQKRYYRGLNMKDKEEIDDHKIKLRLKPFKALPEASKE